MGRGKKAKDPNAPKRPMGAYFLFMNDHRDATKAENPEMKIGEIAKILGQKWANLEKEEKEKYEEQAKQAKAKYEEAKKKYDAGEPADEEEEEEEEEEEKDEEEKDEKEEGRRKKRTPAQRRGKPTP